MYVLFSACIYYFKIYKKNARNTGLESKFLDISGFENQNH